MNPFYIKKGEDGTAYFDFMMQHGNPFTDMRVRFFTHKTAKTPNYQLYANHSEMKARVRFNSGQILKRDCNRFDNPTVYEMELLGQPVSISKIEFVYNTTADCRQELMEIRTRGHLPNSVVNSDIKSVEFQVSQN